MALGVAHDRDRDGNILSAYLVRDGRRHGECRLSLAEEGKLRAPRCFYLHGKNCMDRP